MTNYCVQLKQSGAWQDVHVSCDKWKANRVMEFCQKRYPEREYRVIPDDERKRAEAE